MGSKQTDEYIVRENGILGGLLMLLPMSIDFLYGSIKLKN